MKKKIAIYMSKMSVGGMEKALIDMLKLGDFPKKNDVYLYLSYSKSDEYLSMIPKDINIKLICKGKWNILGKLKVTLFMLYELVLYKLRIKRYDISICYPHNHSILSLLARSSGKKSIVYVHTDLTRSRTKEQLDKLLSGMKFNKFDNIVCVSNRAKESLIELLPDVKNKTVVINNYICGEDILTKSSEKVLDYKFKGTTFINIARHVEQHKKISKIILAAKKLIDDGFNFSVILLGDGEDTKLYRKMIKENKLEDCVKLLGRKNNPYPYLKHSDAFVFSSEYEGYGIVLDEARILNIPIITTDVADSKSMIDEGYGILCDSSVDGIYKGMKEFLEHGYIIKKKFDYEKFNEKITRDTNRLLED